MVNADVDGWAVNAVQMLGIESHVALACANPHRGLQLWDVKASEHAPAATASE